MEPDFNCIHYYPNILDDPVEDYESLCRELTQLLELTFPGKVSGGGDIYGKGSVVGDGGTAFYIDEGESRLVLGFNQGRWVGLEVWLGSWLRIPGNEKWADTPREAVDLAGWHLDL